ncbi:tail assembly protein [Klebsiella pneumoniae]|nr:tail assembly protein [Klebsiella pneumoniae]
MTEITATAPRINVELGGAIGKRFGKKWSIHAATARDALNIIAGNRPEMMTWMRQHAMKYSHYHLRIERPDGTFHDVSEDEFLMVSNGDIATLRITPLVAGAGGKIMGALQVVVGVVLMVASIWLGPSAFFAGLSMVLGGVASLLTSTPKVKSGQKNDNVDSYYFNGPENTTSQGNPVSLIYGLEIMVGSQAINSSIAIDQLM